ncbi:hypothetical protein [Caldimonas caldifontis]|nr:hypothetical protein [Caldimonas caldifontis]
MTPMAWVLGVLTSPLWLGWLYLPWRQWRDHASGRWHPRPLARVTALALLLWVILLWRAPPELALQAVQATATSSAAWRALPATSFLILGPVWGMVWVCCPEALRDTLGDLTGSRPWPIAWLQAMGWGLMAMGAAVYGVMQLASI